MGKLLVVNLKNNECYVEETDENALQTIKEWVLDDEMSPKNILVFDLDTALEVVIPTQEFRIVRNS